MDDCYRTGLTPSFSLYTSITVSIFIPPSHLFLSLFLLLMNLTDGLVFLTPLLSHFTSLSLSLFINHGRSIPSLSQMLMFPEGTTTNGTILIKFKRGENQTLVQILFEIVLILLLFAFPCLILPDGFLVTFLLVPLQQAS